MLRKEQSNMSESPNNKYIYFCILCGECNPNTPYKPFSENLIVIIKEAINFQVIPIEGVPCKICKICLKMVNYILKFQFTCRETKYLLHEYINSNYVDWCTFWKSDDARNLKCDFIIQETLKSDENQIIINTINEINNELTNQHRDDKIDKIHSPIKHLLPIVKQLHPSCYNLGLRFVPIQSISKEPESEVLERMLKESILDGYTDIEFLNELNGQQNNLESCKLVDPSSDELEIKEKVPITFVNTEYSANQIKQIKSHPKALPRKIPYPKEPDIKINRRGVQYKSSASDYVCKLKDNTYRCKLCKMKFKWRSLAEMHVRNHTGERPFVCQVCQKRFKAAHYLNKHVSMVHSKKKHICHICCKRFSRRYLLTDHIKEHEGPPTLPCVHCDKMFYGKTPLTAHIINKHSEKHFMCDVCGKHFKTNARLNDHIVRHSEKSIECTKCTKVFHTKQDMVVHLKRHDTTLAWRCIPCDMFFKTRRGLKLHNRSSHDFSNKLSEILEQ